MIEFQNKKHFEKSIREKWNIPNGNIVAFFIRLLKDIDRIVVLKFIKKSMIKLQNQRKSSLGHFFNSIFHTEFGPTDNKVGRSIELDEDVQVPEEICLISNDPNKPFQYAAEGKTVELKKLIYSNHDIVFTTDNNGMTMLHHASILSKMEVLDILILFQADINAKDNHGNTAIHHAVLNNQICAISYLILKGANPNIANSESFAPIHLSVSKGKNETLNELLKHPEVEKDLVTTHGNTAMHIACEIDNHDALKSLLKSGANICIPNKYGIYPIHMAIKHCNEKCLEILVHPNYQKKCTSQKMLNFSDKDGNVPLHVAVNTGDTRAVEMCLNHGAKIDVRQNDNSTPLHYACTKGELDIVKLMIHRRPEVKNSVLQMKDNNGHTVLHKAVMFNHSTLTEYLVQEGSDLESLDENGWTPLLLAASRLNLETCKILLEKGANIYAKDGADRNIIHLFSLHLTNDKIDVLLGIEKNKQAFADIINEKDNVGCTPLHYSTRRGLLRLTGNLIKLGGVCMTQNNDKDTPLHFAARYGRIHTCRKLLDTIDGLKAMNSTDSMGRLPIHAAAENGHTMIIQMILAKGCIFHRCYHGNTPLHYAASNGHIESCQYLIEINPSFIDNQNQEGKTALHVAAINDRSNVVTLLLNNGASILLDKQGLSFFTHTLKLKNFNTAKDVICNNRWEEIMNTVDESDSCTVVEMIKDMPNIFAMAMDKSISTEGNKGHKDFKIKYNFGILQCKDLRKDESKQDSLFIVKVIVGMSRVDLLMHPLCTSYLKMKWERFGRWVQYIILLLYLTFLCALTIATSMITFHTIKPLGRSENYTSQCDKINIIWNDTAKNCLIILSIYMIIYSSLCLLKEIMHLIVKKWSYIFGFSSYICWALYISTIILSTFLIKMDINELVIEVSSVAIFLGYFNLLLNLFHFEKVGLYVIMFVQILQTLVKVLLLFSILFVGFASAFVILFKMPSDSNEISKRLPMYNLCYKYFSSKKVEPAIKVFQTFQTAFVKTLVMMMGEIEFLNTYISPFYDDSDYTLRYPTLTYLFLIVFIIFVPLLLMNLLIGLAVGDIEAIQKNATLKRISLQTAWLSEFENELPLKFRKWVFKDIWEVYPFKCPLSQINPADAQVIYKKSENDETKDISNMFDTLNIHEKQLRTILVDSRQQTDLLKLILQKMEIDPESEINEDCVPETLCISKNWKTVKTAKNAIKKIQMLTKQESKI